MDPLAGRRADGGLDHVDEGGQVVVGDLLPLVDRLDEGGVDVGRPLPDGLGVVLGDHAQGGPRLGGQDLDVEPQPEAGLVGEEGRHLGQRVAGDHAGRPRRRSSSWRARSASVMASIWTTRRAAFMAPSMATVATGTPRGIWTVA